jgi:hypothetical protein
VRHYFITSKTRPRFVTGFIAAGMVQPKSNHYIYQKKTHFYARRAARKLKKVAGGLGFEPRLTESESVVLPLDDPPIR